MCETKLPKQSGKGKSSEFLSKSSSMGRALGDNRLADSGEYEPMNMINTPSATSNRIEEADIPFDVALAAYHAALEAQENGEKDTKMPESEFDILASARADATRRLIRTPATNAEQLAAKQRVFREEKAHEFFDVEELIPAIFGDAERLAGDRKSVVSGKGVSVRV